MHTQYNKYTSQLQQYTRSTNNNYRKDNVKLTTKHTMVLKQKAKNIKNKIFLEICNYKNWIHVKKQHSHSEMSAVRIYRVSQSGMTIKLQ